MIVNKINGKPDIPEGTEYESAVLNTDGETYTLTGVEYINGVPISITNFQGKEQLMAIGKYDEVLAVLDAMVAGGHPLGRRYRNAFDTIQVWYRTSLVIQEMAASVGIVGTGLDEFFKEAKLIELE